MDGRPTIAVIPARHRATRFPGKPLTPILGVPMIVRVAERARACRALDDVWVATDDARIAKVVEAAGYRVVMTGECASGTDRVAEAVASASVEPAWVVNLQGDEPLIEPADLDRAVREARQRPEAISTLARRPLTADEPNDPNRVKVVMTADGRALYFSRAAVPYGAPTWIHVGVYVLAPAVLRRIVSAPPTSLEAAERLEQLRALELGIPIFVTAPARPSFGVDVPADVARAEAALLAAGERGTI